jgi:hypothetical protein
VFFPSPTYQSVGDALLCTWFKCRALSKSSEVCNGLRGLKWVQTCIAWVCHVWCVVLGLKLMKIQFIHKIPELWTFVWSFCTWQNVVLYEIYRVKSRVTNTYVHWLHNIFLKKYGFGWLYRDFFYISVRKKKKPRIW